MIVVGRLNIFFSNKGRKNEHWNVAELFMFLDTPKHLVAADLRQIPLQQDEIGQRCVCPFFVEQYFSRRARHPLRPQYSTGFRGDPEKLVG